MDSFAVVLSTFSCSSMYEVISLKEQTLCLMSNDHNNHEYIHVTDPVFYPKVKNKSEDPSGHLEIGIVVNS